MRPACALRPAKCAHTARPSSAHSCSTAVSAVAPAKASGAHRARLPLRRRHRAQGVASAGATGTQTPAGDQSGQRAVQFMVDMACQSCVAAVNKSLEGVEGIQSVETELATQSVLVFGTASAERLLEALIRSGRKTRLIGQGSATGFDEELARTLGMDLRTLRQSLAAVAEFKGETWNHGSVVGVVRFVQVNGVSTRVEGALEGLTPGRHALAVHSYGDLTDGAASTGPVLSQGGDAAAGFICVIEADANGRAEFLNGALNSNLQVWDIIGRALVVYEHAAHSTDGANVAAVVARSAVAGDNTKKICACDGTLIWEAGDLISRPKGSAPRRAQANK